MVNEILWLLMMTCIFLHIIKRISLNVTYCSFLLFVCAVWLNVSICTFLIFFFLYPSWKLCIDRRYIFFLTVGIC